MLERTTKKSNLRSTPTQTSALWNSKVALLLPCLNEELTLAKVIRDFRAQIPGLEVYVFDNGSTDQSVSIALNEGAKVIHVPTRGKGNVVRRMFECVEADIYIMVDSDDTYDATRVWDLILPVAEEGIDMTVGSRVAQQEKAFRKFHRLGNGLIISLINFFFQSNFTDICSGYRVMSRNFVKNIPLLRGGFEVETELAVYSLINGFSVRELPLPYGSRPENSHSKLKTFSDGYKVLLTIVWLVRDTRPLLFFCLFGLLTAFGGVWPLRVWAPNALFAQITLAFLTIALFTTGLILNTINVKFSEMQVLQRRRDSTNRLEVLEENRRTA